MDLNLCYRLTQNGAMVLLPWSCNGASKLLLVTQTVQLVSGLAGTVVTFGTMVQMVQHVQLI